MLGSGMEKELLPVKFRVSTMKAEPGMMLLPPVAETPAAGA
jgi:hypothetical protein